SLLASTPSHKECLYATQACHPRHHRLRLGCCRCPQLHGLHHLGLHKRGWLLVPGSSHVVVEYSAERLIAALDDSPLGPPRAPDEGHEEPEEAGDRALARAIIAQLVKGATRA